MSPWVRIDEKAMDHPKIGTLPDGAFRLWVEGLVHCQRHLTDGYIGDGQLRMLRAYSPKRKANLLESGLWEMSETGVRVHDYLQWNESREHVLRARELARERLKKSRGKKRVSSAVSSREATANTPCVVSCSEVPQALGTREGGVGETISERAGAFCQWYEDTHDRLIGVGYMGTQNDYQAALRLVGKFTDAELQDAAVVWFGMEDDFAVNGTRTVPKFASRVTRCLELARKVSA